MTELKTKTRIVINWSLLTIDSSFAIIKHITQFRKSAKANNRGI
jgi:hypothetical protein